MRFRSEIVAICLFLTLSGCHRDDSIPNDVEMTVSGEVVAAKHYTLQIEEKVSRKKSSEVMFFDDALRRLSFRVVETEYTMTYNRVKAKSEMDGNVPPGANLLHENRNGIDYYGYYLPIEEKDWEGHGFQGYVFGKSSVLMMVFAFVNFDDLSIAKKIWLSAKER